MTTPSRLLIIIVAALAIIGTAAAQTIEGTLGPVSYMPLVTGGSGTGQPNPTAVPTATVAPTAVPNPSGCALTSDGRPVDSRCWSNEVVRLVNIERTKAGCPAATIDERLMLGAQNWSLTMQQGSYQHSPLGWYARPENGGFASTAVGENIGPSGTPEEIVYGWMNSTIHRNLILSCDPSDPTQPIGYDPNAVYEIGVGNQRGSMWVLALEVM